MASAEYLAYLQSREWSEIRDARQARDGYRCKNCHRRDRLQVHHWYYTRNGVSILGREDLDDLIMLCDRCHEALTRCRQETFGTGPLLRWWATGWSLWLWLLLFFVLWIWWQR